MQNRTRTQDGGEGREGLDGGPARAEAVPEGARGHLRGAGENNEKGRKEHCLGCRHHKIYFSLRFAAASELPHLQSSASAS